jgi:hypothetical protein
LPGMTLLQQWPLIQFLQQWPLIQFLPLIPLLRCYYIRVKFHTSFSPGYQGGNLLTSPLGVKSMFGPSVNFKIQTFQSCYFKRTYNVGLHLLAHRIFVCVYIALGGLVVACLLLDPWFAGSNPAEDDDGFLRVIKIRSATSFGGEVKPSVPCRRFTACKRTLRAWNRCFIGKIQRPCFSPKSLLIRS